MPNPQVKLKLHKGGEVVIGLNPRAVGVLSSLPEKPLEPQDIPSDLIEMRLDQLVSRGDGWLASCRSIEEGGVPVLLTIRSQAEGGKWSASESERLKLYEAGLAQLAMVDVEFKSKIAREVAAASKRLSKACILSYHNFDRTPELAALKEIITEAQDLGSIVKVSAMARTAADIQTLQNLLKEKWKVPLCVIAMGPLGSPTRVSFAAMGSCLTYGYLDRPSAPGQLSAAELVRQLQTLMPAYAEESRNRRLIPLDQ
jgi:3-dehydroquinate dehydratase I